MCFNKECDLFLKSGKQEKITFLDLAEIFNKAYVKTATMEKAVASFSSTRICPMNPDTFRAEDFEAAHQYMSVTVTDEEHLDSSNLHLSLSTSNMPVINKTSDREKLKTTILTYKNNITVMSHLSSFPSYSEKRKQGAKRKLEIFTATPMKLILE